MAEDGVEVIRAVLAGAITGVELVHTAMRVGDPGGASAHREVARPQGSASPAAVTAMVAGPASVMSSPASPTRSSVSGKRNLSFRGPPPAPGCRG